MNLYQFFDNEPLYNYADSYKVLCDRVSTEINSDISGKLPDIVNGTISFQIYEELRKEYEGDYYRR
jgi:hypothetical protein